MPPRDPKPANSRRRPTPKLDVEEPALTAMLEKYCDLRRRGFGQQAIQTKASWPRHYPSLLLKEAQRRKMPGSQQSQQQAVTEWLLAMFDAGTELRVIQRMSALTDERSKSRLKAALDAASGLPRLRRRRHTELLNKHRALWVDRRYDVRVEAQNSNLTNGTEYTVLVTATWTGHPDGPRSDEATGTPTATP